MATAGPRRSPPAGSGRPKRSLWLNMGLPALLGVALVLLAALLAVRAGFIGGQPPADLGVMNGRLKAPPSTPNSVHSQVDLFPDHPQAGSARIAPLPASGDAAATMDALQAAIEATDGARIVERRPDYLRVEFRTKWVGFVDDAEFWFDPVKGVVQLRSASRLGEDDLGANRERIELLRARLAPGTPS